MRIMNIEMKKPPFYGLVSELAKKNNLSYNTYVRILNSPTNNRLDSADMKREFLDTVDKLKKLYDRFITISEFLSYKEFYDIYREIGRETGISARCVVLSVRKYHSRRFMKLVVDKYEKLKAERINKSNLEVENE